MGYEIEFYSGQEEPLYTRPAAAKLAHVSLEFLYRCEQERFVQPQTLPDGDVGYTAADIRRLARVRRLRYSLELDMPAVEVVLHLRHQVVELQTILDQMEKEMAQRERMWLREIRELRRQMAQETKWR